MSQMNEISVRQAAQRLGVGLGHLYQLLWAGKIPGRKKDGEWLIPEGAVAARVKTKEQRESHE
jgi:excisionase family DNA binding protein